MQKLPARSLSLTLMTGLSGEPSLDTSWTHSRRGVADRSRRPGKKERRRLMLPAIPVYSHARTVPGPASLGSESTAKHGRREQRRRASSSISMDYYHFVQNGVKLCYLHWCGTALFNQSLIFSYAFLPQVQCIGFCITIMECALNIACL